jgi:hypothetical protein
MGEREWKKRSTEIEKVKKNPLLVVHNAMTTKEQGHLFLDLDHASFFSEDVPSLTPKVREEIKALCRFFLDAIPGATLLLTGSLSVGEGKVGHRNGQKFILSDYDMAVVTPSIRYSIPSVIKKKLVVFQGETSLSTRLEISLIWKPFLEHQLTTTAGKIVAGRKDLSRILETLHPPRPGNSLAMAYLYFIKASLNPGADSNLLSKALLRGAQAFLLHQHRFSTRREWGHISSLKFCREKIVNAKEILGEPGIKAIQMAAGDLLGEEKPYWKEEHFVLTRKLLAMIEPIVFPSPGWHDFLKHLFWLWQKRLFHCPISHGTGICIRGLRLMTEAWGEDETQREEGLREAFQLASAFCNPRVWNCKKDALSAYGKLSDLFESYLSFYPNKISFAPSSL